MIFLNLGFTSSQKNFLINSTKNLWNHSLICWFYKRYSYEQLNDSFNCFIEKFDSIRILSNSNSSTTVMPFKRVNYPFMSFENKEHLFKEASLLVNKPIDIKHSLFSCIIFQTEEGSGYIINAHHLILDGLSGQIMCDFLNTVINNGSYSKKTEDYQTHILNETTYVSSKRYKKDRNFWLQQFSSNPQCSIFEEKKTSFDYESDEVNFRIGTDLFDNIISFCNNNNISVQSFFNTVYSVYIYRTLGVDFFTLGVPVLNRTTEAELNTIGLYMHIVPLFIKLSDSSFLQNAIEIEDAQMNLFRHQKFTQHDIKELLDAEGKPQNNLFDIATDYQVFEENEDYEFEFVYSNSLSVPLEIHMQSFGNEKHNLKIRYRTSMFSEKEIETMMNSFIAIIEDALENPDKKIKDLEMISVDEKKKLLYEYNDTEHSYDVSESSTLYSLFEKTAKEKEGKICIRTAEKTLSFRELLKNAEKLDIEIRKITDGQKSVIAVIAERSVEMYSAIYGIIRGGNAYLPIDPDYPQERIDYILENSETAAVVTQDKFVDLVGNVPCINMSELINISEDTSHKVPDSSAEPDDTAYVIYTSGSTGNPKGAKVSHKSAVNRILWMHDKYPLGQDDVILQKTPYTFDVSVWELFWWGICGASLTASKPGEHFLPAKILDEVNNGKVTHLHFVPSVFEIFINYLESHREECSKFDSVRYVFLSGEALSAKLVQRFYKLYDYNRVTLHNLYGPTECAVDVTYYDCVPLDADPVPIGKPIYNTQLYVVDKHCKLTPIGVTGELCIAGINVGQGYLNNPELTAEKFIDNPFGEGKLYKTGDNAYWRDDGQLIFCGRIDGQVKLNGQRIEIGEIETTISDVPSVESAAVVVKKVKSKDMLVAFYCGKKDIEDEIKEACLRTLPRYMIPSVFVRLDSFPLNQSGKLNRNILIEYTIEINESHAQDEPINEYEKIICETFKSVLRINNIGRNSDFFALGGTSLSMISVLSEKCFEEISSSEFIRNSTPAKLATVMQERNKSFFKYLEPLYISNDAEKVLLLIPYAGGGPEAYSRFVSALKNKTEQISIYFLRYLHSIEECRYAAEEIAAVFAGKDVYLYSHCVGSAVALQVLKHLEELDNPVKHYIAGASIPPSRPTKNNVWNIIPDNILKRVLSKAGAKLENISNEDLKDLFIRFRKDTDFANISYCEFWGTIGIPTSLIISKKDLFTKNYHKSKKLWKRYVVSVNSISFIDSKSHYFQSDNVETFIKIFQSFIQ